MASELGMAEMLTLLVSEVVAGITAANLEQHATQRSLRQALDLPDDEFAQRFVTTEEVDDLLGKADDGGMVPRKRLIDDLTASGLAVAANATTLQLVEARRRMIRQQLADTRRLELAEQLSSQSVPRVVVDSGSLRARVSLRAVDTETPARLKAAAAAPTANRDVVFSNHRQMAERLLRSHQELPGIRLAVKSLSPGEALSSQDGYAELMVTFKTL